MSHSSSLSKDLVMGSLAALTISAAWWIPGTFGSALLGWVTAVLLAWIVCRAQAPYRASYISGVLIHPLALYWLFGTIKNFGGFPTLGAAAVFLLFAVISGLQYPLFVLLQRGLPTFLDRVALRTPLAWVSAELIAIRIFPWCIGHTQLAVTPLAQAASIGGVYLLSFLMLWIADASFRVCAGLLSWKKLIAPATVTLLLCIYGSIIVANFSQVSGPLAQIAVVQANVSVEEKHNMKFVAINRQRYTELSRQALGENVLIIWPETVVQDFVADSVGSAVNDARLPFWQDSFTSFLLGAVTFESREDIFNSAVAVFRDGTVPKPYHKRILMPFGEYVPFGKMFPWLKELSGMAGEFSAGNKAVVFEYPLDGAGEEKLSVSPLICYEDIVPRLSREAVQAGAEVLVNITNDGWFGNTAAQYQHHLIASFRAIENHRFLIRSTNTGLTAVVNPLGKTVAELPAYSEGILKSEVIPFSTRTPYSIFGDLIWWLLTGFTVFSTLVVRFFRRRRRKSSHR